MRRVALSPKDICPQVMLSTSWLYKEPLNTQCKGVRGETPAFAHEAAANQPQLLLCIRNPGKTLNNERKLIQKTQNRTVEIY